MKSFLLGYSLFTILCFTPPLEAATYDYFQMVQQWPPATCSSWQSCLLPPPARFTIHGLWPSNYSTVRQTCTGSRFNPSQIARLRNQLNTYWPDVIRGNNQGFWAHEWNAHGTCSENNFNQIQYFQAALNIRTNRNYDLLAILNRAGLGPSGSTSRSYQAIEGAIAAAIGNIPGLRCNTNARTRQIQLQEIILCFKPNGVTREDCGQYAGSNCPNQFVWIPRPSFGAWLIQTLVIFIVKLLLIAFVILLGVFVIGKRFCGFTARGFKWD